MSTPSLPPMSKKIDVQATYAIDWEQRYATLSMRVALDERMRANLDCFSQREAIKHHGQSKQEHQHYRLEGITTQYVSDVVVETGDVLLLTIWKDGSLHARDVWEVSLGKYGDDEQLLYPGNVYSIELRQEPEQE